MKLGAVLQQERQRKGLPAAEVAQQLGLSLVDYQALEAGKNGDFEAAVTLVQRFNDLIEGQVNQLFYPCGIPFTQVTSYNVTT